MIINPPRYFDLAKLAVTLGVHVGAQFDPSSKPPALMFSELHTYDAGGNVLDFNTAQQQVINGVNDPVPPDPIQQRFEDAATLLNDSTVRDTQAHRDAFARLIGFKPLTIPLTQDAVITDLSPL